MFKGAKVAALKSIAHGFKLIHKMHSSVRSVLSPGFHVVRRLSVITSWRGAPLRVAVCFSATRMFHCSGFLFGGKAENPLWFTQ